MSYLRGEAFAAQGEIESALKEGSKIYAGSALRTGKDSKAIVALKDGTEIRLAPGSSLKVKEFTSGKKAANIELSLDAGRLWVKAVKSGKDSTLAVSAPYASFKVKNAVLGVDSAGTAAVYYGMAIASSKGGKANLTSGQAAAYPGAKVSRINDNSEWAAWNQSRDRMSVLVETGEGIKIEDAKKAFDAMLVPNYAAVVEYEKLRREYEDFDLVVNVAMAPVKSKPGTGDKTALNMKITQGFDGGAVDFISEEIPAAGVSAESVNMALVKNAAKVSKAVTYYAYNTVADSRKVIVDVTGTSADAVGVGTILSGTKGVSGLASKDFYGQKTVFTLKYEGLASDLGDVLSGKTVNKKPLNIQKSTKSVLKLTIK